MSCFLENHWEQQVDEPALAQPTAHILMAHCVRSRRSRRRGAFAASVMASPLVPRRGGVQSADDTIASS